VDARVTLLPWDSDFFGFRIGRYAKQKLTPQEASRAAQQARALGLSCVYVFLDPGDPGSRLTAQQFGLSLIDARVVLGRRVEAEQGQGSVGVHVASAEDRLPLRRMGREMASSSRFWQDRRFPRRLVRKMYAQWVEKSLCANKETVVMARDGGGLVGFVSLSVNGKSGQIILFHVHPSCQGQGVGRQLMNEALAWSAAQGVRELEVATQVSNPSALAFYEAMKFRTKETFLIYHWWL